MKPCVYCRKYFVELDRSCVATKGTISYPGQDCSCPICEKLCECYANAESIAAMKSIESSTDSLRSQIFAFIYDKGTAGATCDEVEVELGMRHQTASSQICALKKLEQVIKNGQRRVTRSGRQAAVLVASRYVPAPPAPDGYLFDTKAAS